jgi:hypothetical protein
MKHATRALAAIVMLTLISACDDEKESKLAGEKTYATQSDWDCDGNFCQDVYDFNFVKGSVVDFDISNLTGGSAVQVALYAPGQVLGGTNVLTGNTSEVTCLVEGNCDLNMSGYIVSSFLIPASGVYRLAVTRNHNFSCGSSGDYDLDIVSSKNFVFKEQSVDDEGSLAPQEYVEVCVD